MADLFLLSEAQMRRIERFSHCRMAFPELMTGAHQRDCFVIKNWLHWRDVHAPMGHIKPSTIGLCAGAVLAYSTRFLRNGAQGWQASTLMMDTTHLKAHRTAASLLKKGLFPDVSDAPRVA